MAVLFGIAADEALFYYMWLRWMSEGKNLAADLDKADHFSAMGVLQELKGNSFLISSS